MKEFVLLVYTSSHAIGIEKKLKNLGVPCKLSSIPRNLSSDCGICVRFDEIGLKTVEDLVKTLPFDIQEIVALES
ncbi:DUF3343 domain-containing protein [Flexilinea flocculi]|jgi:hypothetical protein|uniref:Putative Se/S carrier protein-like domain-containing protein n=1 Tax=Flexilinea flocculi TaxID=1678840 RepID=A0A0S7BS27_9CHLR|nr:DUF3343 domain-containing protein [Flexilinea flocculi]GAP40494.1 hypothetical protein ATC1_13470 [Flexilinea flocculi]